MNTATGDILDRPSRIERTASPLRVRFMEEADKSAWNQFVLQSPQATFFHRWEWRDVIEKAFGHRTFFLLAERAGRIEGIFPLAEIRSALFGTSLSSLPFCVYGGVVAQSAEVRQQLEQEACRIATERTVDHLECRNLERVHEDWPAKDLYVTFRREIDPDVEQNMLNIPRKQRAMVRKGIKAGLEGQVDDDVDRFFAAYSDSVHRLGTPVFSKRYFEILKSTFKDDCEVLTIVHQGQLVASVMSFYFRDEVLPYYGGGTVQARNVAGNDFMYWDLMRRACERGYRIFDFGRSKRGTGSFDFKKNWGFTPAPLSYEYQLFRGKQVPNHNPLNPKYRLFIKAWQRLPLPVANFIGPFIVKNLG